jgi:hypothetical protein
MITALCSSRQGGTKLFDADGLHFGWEAIQKVYQKDLELANLNQARLVPGLKYAYIERDNWTKLNVAPAKIMQVFYYIYI